jgi:hypothetical protein
MSFDNFLLPLLFFLSCSRPINTPKALNQKNSCSSYCTESFYYNDKCDPECNTLECKLDNYKCECVPGCSASLVFNNVCDEECNFKECEYDNKNCEDDGKSPSYINLLTIIGFVVIGISFCLIFGVMIWYYRKKRLEMFQQVSSSESTSRQIVEELVKRFPQMKVSNELIGETCTICLDE